MTINFLGSGSSYRQMSFTWGGSVHCTATSQVNHHLLAPS